MISNSNTNNNQSGTTDDYATSHYIFLVIYVAGLSAFGSFVNDMYLPSLPSMMKFFHCSVPVVQLGLTMGMIGLAAGQFILGPISDKYGRKPLLIGSMILFCIASAVSIFSPTIHFFLVCRVFQGIGASGGYFLARAIPVDFYTGRMFAKTMALLGAINGVAPASAPVLGGIISDWVSWKGVFVFLTVFGLILIAFSPKLKESLTPDKRYKGNIWQSFANYKSLLINKPFMIHVMLKAVSLGLLFAYVSSGPFIFETHFGRSQTVFGCIMGGNGLIIALGAMLALKFKPLKKGALLGALILIVSIAVLIYILFDHNKNIWNYELALIPMAFALGIIMTVSNTLSMNEGRSAAGDASAILGIVGYIFGASVSPLVGLGNILHSTAIAYGVLGVLTLIMALISYRLAPDLLPNDISKE